MSFLHRYWNEIQQVLWSVPQRGVRRRKQHPSTESLKVRLLLAASFSEFIDPNPSPGNQFGHSVVPLSTGNVVITAPFADANGTDAGAVYLFNGQTGALISTLRGSSAGDQIGKEGIIALPNGNFLIRSPLWDNAAATDAGAVTWGSGMSGITGTVSASNSLIGVTAADKVGSGGVTVLTNGNYVVRSPLWDNGLTSW